ncbi:hypothetical protein M758_4G001100 [Ceratodon purpureus]|nr:hypothetical protein M758_4G001100 [Ceratodon purpureus]
MGSGCAAVPLWAWVFACALWVLSGCWFFHFSFLSLGVEIPGLVGWESRFSLCAIMQWWGGVEWSGVVWTAIVAAAAAVRVASSSRGLLSGMNFCSRQWGFCYLLLLLSKDQASYQ